MCMCVCVCHFDLSKNLMAVNHEIPLKSPLVSVSCFPFPRPLHLSIIQENIPLTFYLVRLITGVSMNLDIANNLRQVSLHVVGMLKYFLSPSSSSSSSS